MNEISIDLHNAKGFERVFPNELIDFHTKINFTRTEEEVFELVVQLAEDCGFDAVIYEYCPDIDASEPDILLRTNLPQPFEMLERSAARHAKQGYSRRHALEKWTPTVGGVGYADYFEDYPNQIWKYRLAAALTGFKCGFGISLRSPDASTRAGMAFASRLGREEFEKLFHRHGWTLHSCAWAAHIRILQHAAENISFCKPLTERQLIYLNLLADGLLDKEIAHAMNISHSAVRKYQYALSSRFGVTRRADIIKKGFELGLVKLKQASGAQPNAAWNIRIS